MSAAADNHPVNGSGDAISDVVIAQSDACAAANDVDVNSSIDSSSDDVAKALSSLLSSVIRDFNCRAESTTSSQNHLSLSVDRLTGELDQLLEDAPVPFLMQHAARISGVRTRVSSLNVLLKSIQRRLDNVDRVLSVGLQHGQMVLNTIPMYWALGFQSRRALMLLSSTEIVSFQKKLPLRVSNLISLRHNTREIAGCISYRPSVDHSGYTDEGVSAFN